MLGGFSYLLDDAAEVCRELAMQLPLGIVTNGFEEVQRARFRQSELREHVAFLVTSEEVGAAKPALAPFTRALELAGNPDPERVLMIGDRLASDIAGGARAGLRTCWFDPTDGGLPADTAVAPDHRIRALPELLDLVR